MKTDRSPTPANDDRAEQRTDGTFPEDDGSTTFTAPVQSEYVFKSEPTTPPVYPELAPPKRRKWRGHRTDRNW